MTDQNLSHYPAGVDIRGSITPEFAEILTPDAVNFVATLNRTFAGRHEELLQRRAQRLPWNSFQADSPRASSKRAAMLLKSTGRDGTAEGTYKSA